MCWCIHSWKQLSKSSRHLGENFPFSLGTRSTLALPLELEQNQFLIGFKTWRGTFLQSSMNQPYPVEAEWVSLGEPSALWIVLFGPLIGQKVLVVQWFHIKLQSSVMLLEQRIQREKSLEGEKSDAFTNTPWGWRGPARPGGTTSLPLYLSNGFQRGGKFVLAEERQLDKYNSLSEAKQGILILS